MAQATAGRRQTRQRAHAAVASPFSVGDHVANMTKQIQKSINHAVYQFMVISTIAFWLSVAVFLISHR